MQPDVPIATEQGVPLVVASWFAVYAPNGLPADTQARLSAAIQQVVVSDAFKKRAEEQGAKALSLGRSIQVAGLKAD